MNSDLPYTGNCMMVTPTKGIPLRNYTYDEKKAPVPIFTAFYANGHREFYEIDLENSCNEIPFDCQLIEVRAIVKLSFWSFLPWVKNKIIINHFSKPETFRMLVVS